MLSLKYYDSLRENSDHGWDTYDLVLETLVNNLEKISKEAQVADDFDGVLVVAEMLAEIGYHIVNFELDDWQEDNPTLAKKFINFRLELEKALWQFIHFANTYNSLDADFHKFINVDSDTIKTNFAAVFELAQNWFLESDDLKSIIKKPQSKTEITLWRKYLPVQKVFDPSFKSLWLNTKLTNLDENAACSLANILHFWLLDSALLSESEYITILSNFLKLKNNIQKQLDFAVLEKISRLPHFQIKNKFGQFLSDFEDKFVNNAGLSWWVQKVSNWNESEYVVYKYLAFHNMFQSLQEDLKNYGKYYFDQSSLSTKLIAEIENYKNDLIPKTPKSLHFLEKVLQSDSKYNLLEDKVLLKNPIKIVITGKFGLSRTELEKHLEAYGFVVCKKMSGQVEAVIYGLNYTPHKLEQALEKGIPIFNFLELCQILTKL